MAGEAVVASAPQASEPHASSSDATPKLDPPRSAATPSRTPAAGSRRLVFSTPISTPSAPASSLRKNPRTPASGYKMGNEEMCAVCFSPLERDRARRRDFFAEALSTDADASVGGGACAPRDAPATSRGAPDAVSAGSADTRRASDVDVDPKRALFTTDCGHVFHRCCLVKCREQDFSTCPMCRAALPSGLTPEHVRERNAARRLADRANAQQRSIVGAAQRAREAVRAQYVRRMVNRPTRAVGGVPSVIEEEGEGGAPPVGGETAGGVPGTLGEIPPWMSPPRGGSRGGGSAPATPARAVSSSAATTRADGETGGGAFVTAAEELRARANASDAVALAFAVASAPSTPARAGAAAGTVSSVVAGAARGPGNAGTLDGLAAAEEDRRHEEASLRGDGTGRDASSRAVARPRLVSGAPSVASLAAALGAALEDVAAADEARREGSAAPRFAPDGASTTVPVFQSAAEALRAAAVRSASAWDALVAHGTASAPATPAAHRPAVAAAMAAAEAAAAEGDDVGGARARCVMRRLAAE